jgi:diadenosine tetraphosphatase ApaH/serine/threonine PP2A family protein phosphatase
LKHLIFSDIHSNLEAFQAILASAGTEGYDRALSLGDHVGYGANPNECIDALLALPHRAAVRGNHDAAAVEPEARINFNNNAYAAILHTADLLTDTSRQFLETLPLVYDDHPDFLGVHASPRDPDSWGYIIDGLEAAEVFYFMTKPVAFIGHSHVPCLFMEDGEIRPLQHGDTLGLKAGRRCIVNVGSVGQPRDRDPRTAYVMYDDEKKTIRFNRLVYDWHKAAEKIRLAGLPFALADRITIGA